MRAVALGLRLGRWGIVGFSVLAFASSYIQAVGFYQLAGHTPEQRAAFARSMTQLAAQLTILLPPPTRLDTVGGYVEWRSFGGLAILFAVWALVSASGAARGDEAEQGPHGPRQRSHRPLLPATQTIEPGVLPQPARREKPLDSPRAII